MAGAAATSRSAAAIRPDHPRRRRTHHADASPRCTGFLFALPPGNTALPSRDARICQRPLDLHHGIRVQETAAAPVTPESSAWLPPAKTPTRSLRRYAAAHRKRSPDHRQSAPNPLAQPGSPRNSHKVGHEPGHPSLRGQKSKRGNKKSRPRGLHELPHPKKKPRKRLICEASVYGAAGRIRTHDPLVRSQVLYPTELQPRGTGHYTFMHGRACWTRTSDQGIMSPLL